MFNVYINNYKRGSNIVTNETLFFTVPSNNKFPISRPMIKCSEDAADNFSFTMDLDSPYYDSILPYKTTFRVLYDNDIIFQGRVMNISTSTIYHTKNVTCESTIAYFKDSYYEGKQEKHRKKMTVNEYFTKIINNHNSEIPEKTIHKGNVGVTLPSEEDKYEPTAWTQSSSLLSNLTSNYGGHLHIRYVNSEPYLDWYKYYIQDLGDGNRPVVTVGKNILDMSTDSANDRIFTRVIPIGGTDSGGKPVYINGYVYKDKNNVSHTHSTKYMPVTLINDLYTDSQLNDEFHNANDYRNAENLYGKIYTTMQFSDATKQEKLWNLAKKWIKDCYFGFISSFSVKAIDMHIRDSSLPKITIGVCVDVRYKMTTTDNTVWISKKLVCKGIQYDLFNPDNTNYTFGIPSDLLEYNKNNKKSSKKKDASDTSANNNRQNPSGHEDEDVTFIKVYEMIGAIDGDRSYTYENAARSFYNNKELSGTVKCYDPNDIPSGEEPQNNKDKWFNASLIGKITLSGQSTKYVCIASSVGVFAYYSTEKYPGAPAVHPISFWYSTHKGYKYKGKSPLNHSEETGNSYATPDGTAPESDASVVISPSDETGQGSTGTMKVGTSGPNQWRIKLNEPVEYTDADGNTQYADGFVCAEDYNVPSIPSFKTQIGIFKIVIADVVSAREIAAELSKLKEIFSENIHSNTSVATNILSANNVTVYHDLLLSGHGNYHYKYLLSNNTTRNLDACFYDASVSETDTSVTITLSRLNGGTPVRLTFNK